MSINWALRTGLFVQKQNNNEEVICLGDQEMFLLRSDRASKPSSEVLFTLWVVWQQTRFPKVIVSLP